MFVHLPFATFNLAKGEKKKKVSYEQEALQVWSFFRK